MSEGYLSKKKTMRSYFNFQAFENCGYIFSESSCFFLLLNMLSEIAFEQIEGNFSYAAYGPFRVVMMKDTGYVNATKLCISGGKEYDKWSRLISSHELIQCLEKDLALENTHGNFHNSDLTLLNANAQICSLASPRVFLSKLSIILYKFAIPEFAIGKLCTQNDYKVCN